MSIHNLAKQVESKGRGRDTVLVHMTPSEVKGLQSLAMAHGGSLSINPNTGLVEAGFLERILPVVAAGALTYFTAGAAAPAVAGALSTSTATGGLLAGAGIGALLGGGVSAMQGGDFGKGALMGGLTGALGGYGAAGGFEGLAGSTAQTIDPVTGAAGSPLVSAPGTPTTPLSVPADVAATGGAPAVSATAPYDPNALVSAPPGTPAQQMALGPNQAYNEYGDIYTKATGPATQTASMGFGSKAALGLGGLGLASAMISDQQKYGIPEQEDYTSPLKRISPDFRGYEPERPRPYYQATYPTYAASGGVVALAQGGDFDDEPGMDMAKGGISHLGDYSDGGRLLKGPGDGVSDSIPASIGERQPARLADGEFVVPARIVSEIGNGSTDAGARKLYAMMDRVQKARRKTVGKGKVAVNSKADKLLPA